MTCDLLGIAAHPDDIELIAGGTFIKMAKLGYKTGVIDLTRGEMGTRGTPEIRARESEAAGNVLGLSFRENLGFPDGLLEMREDYKRKIAAVIRKYKPVVVVCPYWEDHHQDHAYAGKLVEEGAFIAGFRKLDLEGEAHRPKVILHAMHHQEKNFWPSLVVDVSAEYEQKMKAAHCYESQFYNPDSREPQTNIAKKDFFARIEARMRLHGDLIGAEFGEGFLCKYPLEIGDLLSHFSASKKML